METTDYENNNNIHVDHCSNCFSSRGCVSLTRQITQITCPVIPCRNGCGFKMHCCKQDEHLSEICKLAKIPCPNAYYGCPMSILRKSISEHLLKCPASIVQCCVERNRKVADKMSLTLLKHRQNGVPQFDLLDSQALDLCLALQDQKLINESYQCTDSQLKSRTNSLSKYHPILPMLNSESISIDSDINHNCNGLVKNGVDEDEEVLETPIVSKECIRCLEDPGSQHLHTLGSSQKAYVVKKKPKLASQWKKSIDIGQCTHKTVNNLLVELGCEFLSQSCGKPKDLFTISCDKCVHRREYAFHYINVHCDIIAGLSSGILISRCPMYWMGCTFYQTRLLPGMTIDLHDLELHHSKELDSFHCLPVLDANSPNSLSNFDKLPDDIWLKIFSFTDSWTLYSLSMTSNHFRTLCQSLLSQRGMVQLQWTKSANPNKDEAEKTSTSTAKTNWKISGKKWTFSRAFKPIKHWQLAPKFLINEHVQKCQFFQPGLPTKPFTILADVEEWKDYARVMNRNFSSV